MPETLGLIDLNIARLHQRLRVLEQQLILSGPYPRHKCNLNLEYSQARLQLSHLVGQRREFLVGQAARASDYAAYFLTEKDRAGTLVEYGPTDQSFRL